MKDTEIDALLKKSEELKALFVLGQRVIPFLEEIFLFFKDIKPLLDEINNSIHENLKKMPNASKQLSKITQATELATTEIMDIVDGIVYKSDVISANMKRLAQIERSPKGNPMVIFEIIQKALVEKKDFSEALPQIEEAFDIMKDKPEDDADKENKEIVTQTDELIESIKTDSSSIMMSLQVQDITSQQIAAVNHLLETIKEKLSEILSKFSKSDITGLVKDAVEDTEKTNVSKLHRDIAFDPEAVESYAGRETRQSEVDKLLEMSENGELPEDFTPQTENSADSGENDEPASVEAETTPEEEKAEDSVEEENELAEEEDSAAEQIDDHEEFSQDDIDALFGK